MAQMSDAFQVADDLTDNATGEVNAGTFVDLFAGLGAPVTPTITVDQADLNSDNRAIAADQVRYQAAQELGLDSVTTGSVDDYRNLSQGDQVRLADQMAVDITRNPGGWSGADIADAAARVANPYYGKPLADTSIAGNAITSIADGSAFGAALAGAEKYLQWLVVGALILGTLAIVTRPGPARINVSQPIPI